MDHVSRFELNLVQSFKPQNQHLRVLEIGTGPGRLASQIITPGTLFVGLDISSVMLKACAQRLKGNALYVQSDASRGLPFVESSFDYVYAIRSLKYSTDLDFALAEVYRVLAPGGRFFVSMPNRRSVNRLQTNFEVPFLRMTIMELREKLVSKGFTVKIIHGGPKLPGAFYLTRSGRLGDVANRIDGGLNKMLGPIGSRELYIECSKTKEPAPSGH